MIERGSIENPVVWYATGSTDITGQLVEAYNSQAAVSAPALQAPLRQKAR